MTVFLSNLAGLVFRPEETRNKVFELKPGEGLTLEREPSNGFDENAIKVLYYGEFIGYCEKLMNAKLAAELDAGAEYVARVKKVYPADGTSLKTNPIAKPLIEILTGADRFEKEIDQNVVGKAINAR